MTHQGHPLGFNNGNFNKKESVFPKAKRFANYKFYDTGSGVSCYVGPGTYNDHEDYYKLSKRPCSSVMVTLIFLTY